MVVYDLICSQGHRFEGWFQDLNDLEDQLDAHLLSCPVCGDEAITRRPSTFGLVKSGRTETPVSPPAGPTAVPGPEQVQEMIRRWSEISSQLERDFDDVGSAFADEALKMHYGVTDHRNIRGLSTESQEEMLRKEGVDFYKVPFLTRKNPHSTKN